MCIILIYLIGPHKVLYRQADGNYTDIYLTGGSKETVTLTMIDLVEKLINPDLIRVNRVYMINKNFLSKVDRMQ